MSGRGGGTPWAVGLFRRALRAFPREFRARFEDSMLDTFEERYRARVGGRPWFVVKSVMEVVVAGLTERLRPSRAPSSPRPRGAGRAFPSVGPLLRELRLAVRMLARRPGFTLTAVGTVALGIGASVTVFGVVDGVLLEPLPYPEPEGLVVVEADWSGEYGVMSYLDLVDVEAGAPSIDRLVGVAPASRTLTGLGDPERVRVARVTGGLMEVFRMAPTLGRDIRGDEFGPDGPRVAVISHALWQERFGGESGTIGRTLRLNDEAFEIVGVAPLSMDFPDDVVAWIPWRGGPATGCGRGCHNISAFGRLVAGADVAGAQREVDIVRERLAEAYPESNDDKRFRVQSLQALVVGDVRDGLRILLGAVALVLLIACVNVANLLLVRATARESEMAVRTALGASRLRVVLHSLGESLVIAAAGGVLGVGLSHAALTAIPRLSGDALPRVHNVGLDGTALLFALVAVVGVTLLFGLAPALLSARSAASGTLRARGGGGTRGQLRLRSGLLAGEVALSAMLLVGAGLLARSMQELYAVDLGYETTDRVRFDIGLPVASYPDAASASRFYRTLEERLSALPGVRAVGTMWGPPLGRGNASGSVTVEGRADPRPEDEVTASVRSVGPGLLETLAIPVLAGRDLTRDDHRADAEPVALVNESLARRLFDGRDPMGETVFYGVSLGYSPPNRYRIVGVVPDLRIAHPTREPVPEIWVPHGIYGPASATVTLHATADVATLVSQIRDVVRSLDPDVPVYRIETMDQALGDRVADTRFYTVLSLTFALLAALLAAVGIYGVAAFAVSRRTREIGLRVALGARRARVAELVLRQGMGPAVVGLAVGLGMALVAARLLESILFGVAGGDLVTFVGTAVLLLAVAAAATLAPARRATGVDPVAALRAD